jgi:predicted RecB family endonuclease
VDFVIEKGGERLAIEVKSARKRVAMPGLEAFEKAYGPCRKLLVGGQGMDLEGFLSMDPISLL